MDFPTLSERIQELQRAVNWWNDLNILMVAGTAIFAVGVLVTQYIVVQRGRQLTVAQDELLKEKDKQLELDLKTKDIGIEEAKERAAKANSRTEELKQQNLETEKKLEQERLARVEIEERVAFRRIPEKNRSEIAARLKSFAGVAASTWFRAGDHEGATFASDIASVLIAAKWVVYAPASYMDFAESGRRGAITTVNTGVVVASTAHDVAQKASEAIVRELVALGFDARKSPTVENRATPVVIVTVESRPEGPQGEAKIRKRTRE